MCRRAAASGASLSNRCTVDRAPDFTLGVLIICKTPRLTTLKADTTSFANNPHLSGAGFIISEAAPASHYGIGFKFVSCFFALVSVTCGGCNTLALEVNALQHHDALRRIGQQYSQVGHDAVCHGRRFSWLDGKRFVQNALNPKTNHEK
jgi:hypothetical protein